ncbi:MAG: hypothetical protein M1830_008694 [Pleopsidium flavum]|nr:MAG: hypothetical protein M1830_008694 [Pleopsidium flavum]
MGILQNLKLWENNVTLIDERGVKVIKKVPRAMPPNPWKIIRMLSAQNWLFFLIGLMAWTADGYDFNSVNLVSTELAKRYNRSLSAISLSITLTLLFRSLGALIIGMSQTLLQVATAYAPTYGAFIGVRALFGIFMGGIWGLAAAISLENMPVEARGLFSGLLQQGYALGYLIAAAINLGAVSKTSVGHGIIFFVGAGFTALVAIAALFIPESPIYSDREQRASAKARYSFFWKDLKLAARMYWRMFLYCILLCMAFNWMSHGAQDVYPNYLKVQKGLPNTKASIATMIGQCGAVVGGCICGYYSQFLGRRLTVVLACCFGLAMIPLWTIPSSFGALAAGEFFLQSAQNGAWGVMPILLNEYAPPQFRGVFPGTVYQLGNMLSAPAAEIQTVSASAWIVKGKPNYSQVMTIVMCIVFTASGLITACGQERLGSHFELVKRAGAEENIENEIKELRGVEDEERASDAKVMRTQIEYT